MDLKNVFIGMAAALSTTLIVNETEAQPFPLGEPLIDGDALSFQCGTHIQPSSLEDVVAQVSHAAVEITVWKKVDMPFGITSEADAEGDIEIFGRGESLGLGSGVIIDDKNGYVVTNAHVLENINRYAMEELDFYVTLFDPNARDYKGKEYKADLVGIDASTVGSIDLAVLQLDVDEIGHALTCAKFANSDDGKSVSDDDDDDIIEVRVGTEVFIIGSPNRLAFTTTYGRISHTKRDTGNPLSDMVQTDAAINKGNSGGGAFTYEGDIAGIATAIYSHDGGNVGLGFLIPAHVAENIANRLIQYGEIRRGWLGAQVADRNDGNGVFITGIEPYGPANTSNLRKDDVIRSLNGNNIQDSIDLIRAIADIMPGEQADLTVERDGETIIVSVVLGDRSIGAPRPVEPEPEEEETPGDEEKTPNNEEKAPEAAAPGAPEGNQGASPTQNQLRPPVYQIPPYG